MNSTNLNIVLTNALCCISAQSVKVSKLLSIGSKCAEAEIQKLKLMIDWFEVLKCYNAEESINSKFIIKLEYSVYLSILGATSSTSNTYNIIVNDIEYSIVGDGIKTVIELFEYLIPSISEIISFNQIIEPGKEADKFVYVIVEAKCDITSVKSNITRIIDNTILINSEYSQYQTGLCTVINCLTKEQFNIIVANLMAACNICECQLTQ